MKSLLHKLIGHSNMENNKPIILGGMSFDERSLFTNLIAFGAIGAGKTAAIVYPMLAQLCNRYNKEDSTSPAAKFGGFVLDVKGDFHEALIYTLEQSGRDVLKDLVMIRPDNDYYIVEFEDLATKDRFFTSATGGLQSQECDKVLAKATGPEDILKQDPSGLKFLLMPNGDQEKVSSFLFIDKADFLRPEVHNALKKLEFDVTGMNIRWLGWREEDGHLVRVANTKNKTTQFARSTAGSRIVNNKPTRLKYTGVHSLNNGLTYNLVAKTATSTEAARRLMAVAEVTGNSMGGDNAYWSNASEKHIAACIELFRQVQGPVGSECSIKDIQKLTTNDTFLNGYILRLQEVIKAKQQGSSDNETLMLRNLNDYFTGDWVKHDPRTKGNIMSCVTNLFGDVTRNQQLIKTFCQPSKFSFEDCLNDGKIYTLVLSAYPNAQQLIGTCMKLDFQQTVLKRTTAAPVNKSRFLLFLADEYQYFLTTSGGKAVGDDKFLSVSRQSRIFNMICAQALSSFLAVQKDEHKINAFLQCFGNRIFLQNLDAHTNKHAEALLGQVYNEKVSHSGADLKLSSLLGEGKSGSASRSTEKSSHYEESHFGQMAPFEVVMFNKERPPGAKIVKANLKENARFWDKGMLADAANKYYQAYLENRAFELGIPHFFNTRKNSNSTTKQETQLRKDALLQSWVNCEKVQPDDDLTHGTTQDTPDIFFNDPIQPEIAGSTPPPVNEPTETPKAASDNNPKKYLWILLAFCLGAVSIFGLNYSSVFKSSPALPISTDTQITIINSPNLGGPTPNDLAEQMVLAIAHIHPDQCLFVGHRFLKKQLIEYLSAISKTTNVRILLGSNNGQAQLDYAEDPLRQFYFSQLVSSAQPINTQVLVAFNDQTKEAVCYIGTFPFDLNTSEHSEYVVFEIRDYLKCKQIYQTYSKLLPAQPADHTLQ